MSKTGLEESEPTEEPDPKDESLEEKKLDAQMEALRGIAALWKDPKEEGETINWEWTRIFQALAVGERRYLQDKDKRLLANRAISLVVAILFAFLTGANTFEILLGSEAGPKLFLEVCAVRV